MDVIYSKFSNSYYIYEESFPGVFRKRVDKKEPEIWVRYGTTAPETPPHSKTQSNKKSTKIIEAALQGRLILIKNTPQTIMGLEVDKEGGFGREICCLNSVKQVIQNFAVLGKEGNIVLAVTDNGEIVGSKVDLNDSTKNFQVDEFYLKEKIWMFQDREEMPSGISVCNKGRFVVLEIAGKAKIGQNGKTSRMLIFEFFEANRGLKQRKTIDLWHEDIGKLDEIAPIYLNQVLVLVALSEKNRLFIHAYSSRNNEARELKDLRQELDVSEVKKLIFSEDENNLFCVDSSANLVRLLFYDYSVGVCATLRAPANTRSASRGKKKFGSIGAKKTKKE